MNIDADVVGRIAAAVALGALVGIEREAADQPAGLRTHITVALGACLFGIVSTLGFEEFRSPRAPSNVQIDVTRVASQVVVGIGFLGAGVIFRRGGIVRNLTTAASLWVTAAIGLSVGVGNIANGFVATVALVVALFALRPLRAAIRQWLQRDSRRVRIALRSGADPDAVIAAVGRLEGVELRSVSFEKEDGAVVLVTDLHSARTTTLDGALRDVVALDDVHALREV